MEKYIVKKFESIAEMHTYLERGKVQKAFVNKENSLTNSKSFTGTTDYDEAEGLLLYGDEDSAKKVNAAGVEKVRKNIQKYINKRSIYTSPVGFAAHVPNYLAGTPNSMIAQRITRQPKKVITVVYSDTAHSGVTAKEISDTAAKVFSALVIIEAGGVQVNMYSGVTAWESGRSGVQRVGFFTKIKKAGQRFDILRMCYPCINPSWLRRHYFRFIEVTEGIISDYASSYGHVSGQTETEDLAKEARINADAVLTFEGCRYASIEEIIEKVTKGTK